MDNVSKLPAAEPENTTQTEIISTQGETSAPTAESDKTTIKEAASSPASPGSYSSEPTHRLTADPTKMTPIEESPRRVWRMNINAVTNTVACAPKYYDPKLYHKETRNAAEYFGHDFMKLHGLKFAGSSSVNITVENNTGKVVYDAKDFVFNEAGYAVHLYVGKAVLPYDTIYTLKTNDKTMFKAKNETVSVLIGQTIKGGPLFADFSCGELNFRVDATGIAEKDFPKIIQDVIDIVTE